MVSHSQIKLNKIPSGVKLLIDIKTKEKLFLSAIKKAGNEKNLCKILGISRPMIYLHKNDKLKFVTAGLFVKLLNFLQIKNPKKYILNISSIESYYQKMVITKNEDLLDVSKELRAYLGRCPKIKTSINWFELFDKRKIKLKCNFQKKIFTRLLLLFSEKRLEKALSKSRFMLREYAKGERYLTIKTLKKALKLLKIPPKSINNNIVEVSSIKNPQLPFRLNNPKGGEIRMAFLSDGHCPSDKRKNIKYQAGEIESHKRITELCRKLLGDFNARTMKGRGNYFITYFPCVIGDILELGGVVRGRKTKSNPFVPKDIFSKEEVLINSLRRSLTDEGHCDVRLNKITVMRSNDITKHINGTILPKEKDVYLRKEKEKFAPYVNNLLMGEYLGLNKLGIKCRINPLKTRRNRDETISLAWKLEITTVSGIEKFKEFGGFLLNKKNEKINSILMENRKYNRLKDSLEAIKTLSRKKDYFTYQEFANAIKVCPERGLFHLRRLIFNGYVKRIGVNKYTAL